jgi:hypothetical protein
MKVKVRRASGLTGSQRDYGLVTGSVWNYEDKPTSNNVGTTLSAVPRDEATIEAERGETVVGDLDNDGMVEHAKIGGKRHSHGGTPLNVPDGSFVFSDYRGLLIKNPDVLKTIFGMKTNKAVTPAKVAQRYEINKFKDMLNDPFVDPIDRKTAQLMIDNNMKKLGQLALIQEGMKGFPDGIPAIAQPLMGSDFGQQGGQQMMRKGGIVSFKKGGPAKYQGKDRSQVRFSSDLPDDGIIGYDEFGQPLYTDSQGTMTSYFNPQTGEPIYYGGILPEMGAVYQRTPEDKQKAYVRQTESNPKFEGWQTPAETMVYRIPGTSSSFRYPYSQRLDQWEQGAEPMFNNVNDEAGLLGMIGTGAAAGYLTQRYGAPVLDATGRFIKNIPGVRRAVNLVGEGLGHARDFVYPSFSMNRDIARMAGLNPSTWELITGKPGLFPGAWRLAKDIAKSGVGIVLGAGAGLGANAYWENEKANQIPDDALDNKGAVSTEQIEGDAGMINYTPPTRTTSPPAGSTTVQKIPGTSKVVVRKPAVSTPAPAKDLVVKPSGNAVRLNMDSVDQYQSGNNVLPEEELGGSLGMYQGQNRSQVFTQFTPESQILNTPDYSVIGPKTKIPYGFTVQHFDPKKGYYTITNPDTGETMPFDMDDFVNTRQGELLDEYTGGRNAWREDALSLDEKTRTAANDWFQGRYDEWRGENKLSPYFYGTPGKNPYGRDKKFGIYTYSAPGIKKKVKPETIPEPQPDPKPEEEKITPPNWEKTKTKYPEPRYADLLGEWGAAMQEIRRYPSAFAPVNNRPTETIYERYNPQTDMGVYTTALQNAGTGPDSARNIDNISGKVLEAVAQGQDRVQSQINNPRYLQMASQNLQAAMAADRYNAGEKVRYLDDVATKWQDYLANYNKNLANVTEKKATTAENQYKLALMKAMYPYANLDYDQTPTANATLRSITDTPIVGSGASGSDGFSSTYQSVVDNYIKQGLSKEKAVEQANAYMRNYIAMTKAGTAGAMTDPFGIIPG